MGLFGRRKRQAEHVDEPEEDVRDDLDAADADAAADPDGQESGPWDAPDAPDDEIPRLDLGSILVPVPDGAQLQVELNDNGTVKAVHVLTPIGQVTLNAYAAPRSGGLWAEVCGELATQLKSDGAAVRSLSGDWGQELGASFEQMALRFIGVDGPRWMLRGVVAGPPEVADQSADGLRELMRHTVVVRGDQPMPVSTPLPIELPQEIAQHIAAAQQEQQQEQ